MRCCHSPLKVALFFGRLTVRGVGSNSAIQFKKKTLRCGCRWILWHLQRAGLPCIWSSRGFVCRTGGQGVAPRGGRGFCQKCKPDDFQVKIGIDQLVAPHHRLKTIFLYSMPMGVRFCVKLSSNNAGLQGLSREGGSGSP